MKILAIDPGEKRVGLAATDELQITTRLLPVLKAKGGQALLFLTRLIQEEEFRKVLVGLPLNMDGSVGKSAELAKALAGQLQVNLEKAGFACEIVLWDERLTSYAAEERLKERGIAKADAKDFFDSIAAEILLEDYLHSQAPGNRTLS